MNQLHGARVLVADDESLVAMFAEDMLISRGALPVGPAGTVAAAHALIDAGGFDAAILDVNLHGRSSEPIARQLTERKIPFVIVTGYGRVDWDGVTAPVLAKPYDEAAIVAALEAEMSTVAR